MKRSLLIVMFLSVLVTSNSFAGMFDSEEDKKRYEKIMVELKKIAIRTKKLEMQYLATIQENQAELGQQIEQLQTLIPGVQGAMEATKSELTNRLQSIQLETQTKLDDLAGTISGQLEKEQQSRAEAFELLKNEMLTLKTQVSGDVNQLKEAMAADLGQLKVAMATDMEGFKKANDEAFQSFAKTNFDSLQKIETQLNDQSQKIAGSASILKGELIPAIIQQGEKNQTALLTALTQSEQNIQNQQNQMKADLEARQDMIQANLKTLETNSLTMVEVFKKNAQVDEETRNQVGALGQELVATNKNLDAARFSISSLKDFLDTKWDGITKEQQSLQMKVEESVKSSATISANVLVADEKLNKLAQSLQFVQEKNGVLEKSLFDLGQSFDQAQQVNRQSDVKMNKIIEILQNVISSSSQIDTKIDQSLMKMEEHSQTMTLADEKMTNMIDVIQTVGTFSAQIDGKLDQALQKIEAENAAIQIASQKDVEMIDLLNRVTTHSSQISQKLDQSMFKLDEGQEKVRVVNEKILKLIDILKTIASQQQRMDQFFQQQAEFKNSLTDLNQKATVEIAKDEEIQKALVDLNRKANVKMAKEEEIQKALVDLRRKANVTIARSDEIKKFLQQMQKNQRGVVQ